MLQVRVTVGPSPIHGLGVFAAEPIAKGTVVWQFTPGLDLDTDLSLLRAQPPLLRERLLHYGYVDKNLNRYVLCCDDARFLNHSSSPNLETDYTSDAHGIDRACQRRSKSDPLAGDVAEVDLTHPGRGSAR